MTPQACRVDCLRVSITDRCDLRCAYCMPADGIRCVPHESILRFEEIATVVRILKADYGLRTVRLTGGEPLVRSKIADLARMIAATGIEDLAVTTNGQRLAQLTQSLRDAGVRRVNISLDSLDPTRFAKLTRGGSLDATLAGIEAARAAGLWPIKLNTVVLRGENDSEVCDILRFALERDLEVRFLELMEIGVAIGRHAAWFVSADEVIERLRAEFRLDPLPDRHSRTRPHLARDRRGRAARVGFIAPESHPFCSGCRRLRLTADGRLLGCLMQPSGQDLRPLLRKPSGPDEAELREAIAATLAAKPARRARTSDRFMAAVGG